MSTGQLKCKFLQQNTVLVKLLVLNKCAAVENYSLQGNACYLLHVLKTDNRDLPFACSLTCQPLTSKVKKHPFYRVPEHGSCCGMSQWIQAFCVIKLPCSATWYKRHPVVYSQMKCQRETANKAYWEISSVNIKYSLLQQTKLSKTFGHSRSL